MNVIDDYKFMLLDEIKFHLNEKRAEYTSVFINLEKDFNKAVAVNLYAGPNCQSGIAGKSIDCAVLLPGAGDVLPETVAVHVFELAIK